MTRKFKVGDKVRKIRNFAGTEGVVVDVYGGLVHYQVTKEGADSHGPRLNEMGSDYANYFELIPPEELRLFRKGDKVTVTYEVMEDKKAPADKHCVMVNPIGRELPHPGGYLRRGDATLRYGKLEPAPEPSYVPKPGDLFRLKSGGALYFNVCRCLFVDEKSLMYESGIEPSLRFIMHFSQFKNPVFERV